MEELVQLKVEGATLAILLRDLDSREKPILIFNHGGPGSTLMPFSTAFDSELLKYFSIVHWDQRGAGKSFDRKIFSNPFSPEQFINDTKAVIEFIKKGREKNKIYLIGHSWGSLIGLKFSSQFPHLIDGYLGVGQLIDDKVAQMLGYTNYLVCDSSVVVSSFPIFLLFRAVRYLGARFLNIF